MKNPFTYAVKYEAKPEIEELVQRYVFMENCVVAGAV